MTHEHKRGLELIIAWPAWVLWKFWPHIVLVTLSIILANR